MQVVLHNHVNVRESRGGPGRHLPFDYRERPHQTLAWRTPHKLYFGAPWAASPA